MPAHFWFEERDNEKYWSHPKTVTRHYYKGNTKKLSSKGPNDKVDEEGKVYYETSETDWKTKVYHTKEEWKNRKETKQDIYRSGDVTNLQRVDELICEFMGEPAPVQEMDSVFFHWCHETAFWVLYKCGGDVIGDKPEHLPELHQRMDKQIANWQERLPENQTVKKMQSEGYVARCHALIDWVFLKKWRYHATGN